MHREEQIRDVLGPMVTQLMIIVFSLMSGIAAYAGVVISTVGAPDFAQLIKEQPSFLAITAVALALSNLVLANTIPRLIVAYQRGQMDSKARVETNAKKLSELYSVTTIISGALFEGAGFMGVITFQLEGSLIGLSVAIVMVLSIAALFPTLGRATTWVERQLEMLEDSASRKDSF